MNKNDRKEIQKLLDEITTIMEMANAEHGLEGCGDEIRSFADAEQEKFDNMSEALQGTENGQRIQSAAEALAEGADYLEEAKSALENAIGAIERALEG